MTPNPKQKAWRSPSLLKYIRTLPCVCTGKEPCEPHHVKIKGNSGMGRKPSDYYSLPVTREIHDLFGEKRNTHIEEIYNINIYEELFKTLSGWLKLKN